MPSPFKPGSQVAILNEHFKAGRSITHEEASSLYGIGRLAQRMQDLKLKYLKYTGACPIMAYDEPNEKRTGFHTRYFFRGCGCELEHKSGVRAY